MTDADYMTEDELGQWLQQLSLVESGSAPTQPPSRRPAPGIEIDSVNWGLSKLNPGKNVELNDGSFLRIEKIYITAAEDIILTGKHMKRENCLKSLMPKRRNELIWVIEQSAEQAEFGCAPDPVKIPIARVKRLRQIVFTNHVYGTMCHKDFTTEYHNVSELAQEGPLFCRWKRTTVIINRRLPLEVSICALSIDEADQKARGRTMSPQTDPGTLRFRWRGPTAPGGSHVRSRHSTNLDGSNETVMYQQYTFGDAFCGAGGVSSGAQAAGLCLRWAFDHDSAAVATYQKNFARHGVSCFQHSVDVFLQQAALADRSIDILHMSPPCQPFSPAHTIPNEAKDEINQAALFSVLHLVQRIKPRVATVEETEGLISRHDQWFSVLINIFTSQGYSVRWRVVRCEQFGVPQTRKRLLIVAAG